MPLLITNNGDTQVTIESIEAPEGFSAVSGSFGVNVNSSLSLPVKFEPSEERAYSGNLIVNTTAGSYEVALSGTGVTVTSIDRNQLQNTSFSIYPNPATDEITIDLSDVPFEINEFMISNTQGQQMMQGHRNELMQLTINVRSYSKGVYYFSLMHEGQRVIKKFMVIR